MYWILAAILILITLAAPRLRPLGVAGLIILAAMLTWAVVQRMRSTGPDAPVLQERRQPRPAGAPQRSLPLNAVLMQDMQMTGGGAPFELRGKIVNEAGDMQLKSVTIRITRRDCYESALDPTGCAILWQDRHWMPLVVPPGEGREFASSIWMRGAAPRPRGVVQDSFELVAATGEAAAPDEGGVR